jgi:hypothetical protein
MKRFAIVLTVATLLCALALPAYSISTTVTRCTALAEQLLHQAVPLDRNPPARMVAAINKWIGLDRLSSAVAITLLDRFACNDGKVEAVDWLVGRSMLSWWLERRFDQQELIAIYAGSADMQNGVVGFNNGAKLLYSRELDQLGDREVACLMQRATGRPIEIQARPRIEPAHWPQTLNVCPSGLQDIPLPTMIEQLSSPIP